MESLRSFNLVLGLLADTATINTYTIKSINSYINKLQFETNNHFRLSAYYNVDWHTVNATYILSQLLNYKRETINNKISSWMKTKDGVWAIDMLVNNAKDEYNEELVYKYKNHSLWKYYTDKKTHARVYRKEFVTVVIRDGVYNESTDTVDITKLKHIGTNGQFWIETEHSKNPGDVWCSLDFLYDHLFKLFNFMNNDYMTNIKNWMQPLIQTQTYKDKFNIQDKNKTDFQFYINDDGSIAYKLVERKQLVKPKVNQCKQCTNEKEYYPIWGEYLDDDTAIDTYALFNF